MASSERLQSSENALTDFETADEADDAVSLSNIMKNVPECLNVSGKGNMKLLGSIRSQTLINSDNEESTVDDDDDDVNVKGVDQGKEVMLRRSSIKTQLACSCEKLDEPLRDKLFIESGLTRSTSSIDLNRTNERLNRNRQLWREQSLLLNQNTFNRLEHNENYVVTDEDMKVKVRGSECAKSSIDGIDRTKVNNQQRQQEYERHQLNRNNEKRENFAGNLAKNSQFTCTISDPDEKEMEYVDEAASEKRDGNLAIQAAVRITINNDFNPQETSTSLKISKSATSLNTNMITDELDEPRTSAKSTALKDLSTRNCPPLTLDATQLLIASNRLSPSSHYSNQSANLINASLSDNSLQSNSRALSAAERHEIHERLKIWKKSNKIFGVTGENPFNLKLDHLESLGVQKGAGKQQQEETRTEEEFTDNLKQESSQRAGNNNEEEQQQQLLQDYATHLSQLYKRNQTMMDNNSDFRTLLYNIICCLLIQNQQVLATPSVTKMIEVIRSHLESTSKLYGTASQSLSNMNDLVQQQQQQQQQNQLMARQMVSHEAFRKSSIGSTSNTSSTGSSSSPAHLISKGLASGCKEQRNFLQPTDTPERRGKPTDFRRISSVSYNDEQLINDLCEYPASSSSHYSVVDKRLGAGCQCEESPWKYDELSRECKQYTTTSQSSLDNNNLQSSFDRMNDSGIGERNDELLAARKGRYQKRYSLESSSNEYLKIKLPDSFDSSRSFNKQRINHDSSDDYSNEVSVYDESCTLHDCGDKLKYEKRKPSALVVVDVASRRAELEWTLNRLINFELKYTWLTSKDTLRRAIRKIGVPNEIRGKVWSILIDQIIGENYNATKLLDEASETIGNQNLQCEDEETHSILKQIDLDVNRTMPGHKLFTDGAEGGIKLRRILVAYSIHINRAIAYCQGFNFIVALLLSVFEGDEQKALRGFVCIVDHIFPSKFYFDHYLTGARADQFLLADFICDQLIKNPTSAERKMVEGVTSSITLNWFISLFHGAVPTLTRLTILDHFMLEGVKVLFRFTMAILYLAFQITPPSSCEVFTTIRNTARDMYDIKLLLSIVEQIKLPKDSYFAIRRSFYMVQSSFNSDQFYMQSLTNDANRHLVSNKPLSVQQLPDTKLPAMSLITSASLASHPSNHGHHSGGHGSGSNGRGSTIGPRVCMSSNKTKVCIQNLGKLGRSHIKIIDAAVRSNERALMSPLRNCLVIGISNCGKIVVVARQASRRNFKTFREQDLIFHVHELCAEIFDGFYLEESQMVLIMTHAGEVFKIDVLKCYANNFTYCTETLMLRDSHSVGENEKLKLRLTSLDALTNLLWIYVECEDVSIASNSLQGNKDRKSSQENLTSSNKFRSNKQATQTNKYDNSLSQNSDSSRHSSYQRKIIIIDVVSFDIFSAFSLHKSFGDFINMRTSLVSFCQLGNPMSNQFSSRIVRIGPMGHYEHLLSFSDVVDFLISVPEVCKSKHQEMGAKDNKKVPPANQRYSSIKRLFPRSLSLNTQEEDSDQNSAAQHSSSEESRGSTSTTTGTLTKYYRSLLRRHSTVNGDLDTTNGEPTSSCKSRESMKTVEENWANSSRELPNSEQRKRIGKVPSLMNSYLSDIEDKMESNYIPVNMVFIFRNGKIALFEFTQSYAIHTRESQLDRYDYFKVVEVTKKGTDFIITILTIFDRLIKVVI